MLIRQLLLAFVLLAIPASGLAASDCCRADDLCCAGEQPACPVGAAGECASIAAGRTAATISTVGNELPAPLPAQRVELRPVSRTDTRFSARSRRTDPAPSLRFQPLRN